MRVEVLDNDLIGSDMLGYTTIGINECLENPSKWQINKLVILY